MGGDWRRGVTKEIFELIQSTSKAHGIDQNLVMAIATAESAGNPLAVRYEPNYNYFWYVRHWSDILSITYETEQMLQATSFGLMQTMGAVCREYGYNKTLVAIVSDPEAQLLYGITHIKKFLVKYGIMEDAIAAYNAGSVRKTSGGFYQNQKYVDKVMNKYRLLNKLQ